MQLYVADSSAAERPRTLIVRQLIGTMLGAGICLGGARGWWEGAQTRSAEKEGDG
jgi:hypothetical protein